MANIFKVARWEEEEEKTHFEYTVQRQSSVLKRICDNKIMRKMPDNQPTNSTDSETQPKPYSSRLCWAVTIEWAQRVSAPNSITSEVRKVKSTIKQHQRESLHIQYSFWSLHISYCMYAYIYEWFCCYCSSCISSISSSSSPFRDFRCYFKSLTCNVTIH